MVSMICNDMICDDMICSMWWVWAWVFVCVCVCMCVCVFVTYVICNNDTFCSIVWTNLEWHFIVIFSCRNDYYRYYAYEIIVWVKDRIAFLFLTILSYFWICNVFFLFFFIIFVTCFFMFIFSPISYLAIIF